MKALELSPIKDAAFAMAAEHEGDRITVTMSGNADMGAVARLDGYLPLLHLEAARLGVTGADVDLRQLEFMSSSCFKSFIIWLGKVQEMPEASRYKVHFIANPDTHWQRRSLRALQAFAVEIVTIGE